MRIVAARPRGGRCRHRYPTKTLLGLVVTLGGGTLANPRSRCTSRLCQVRGISFGNLLCGVANLLNGTGATGVTGGAPAASGLQNILQQLLNLPALLNL
jgi:hypothetical protein